MYDDILLPTDGGDGTGAALVHAEALATAFDATVHVLYVADTNRDSVTTLQGGETLDVLVGTGERIVGDTADSLDQRIERVTEVVQGTPHRTIVDYVDQYGIDVVVMATHGREGLERYLLGSVTEKVVRAAPVPVLTVRFDGE
ncbi:universal stress protein [Candidatus Halobonum tyrrellensis]|uniref:UspA domain-containing protein n=1 Tax=Candidatus Halobonum tyrrellensis G22 TaxID=1324957 RepID=V4HL91_9EURY|nr:universal stress protein [Candidatus Halobonum tyrrellensis]ESP88694.1 UspA domain-containing protein [Candidatus Halobonum tyrrellensis G22]